MPARSGRRIAAAVAAAVVVTLVAAAGLIVVLGDPGSGSAASDPEPRGVRFFAPDSF